jgi:hypothetical protein
MRSIPTYHLRQIQTTQVKEFEGIPAAIKMQMQAGDVKEAHAFVKLGQNLSPFFPWVNILKVVSLGPGWRGALSEPRVY